MKLAIEQARLAATIHGAVGCVIVRNGRILASGYNEAEMNCDPTAHAEIVTLRRLGRQEGRIKFDGCSLLCHTATLYDVYVRLRPGGHEPDCVRASRQDVNSMYSTQSISIPSI